MVQSAGHLTVNEDGVGSSPTAPANPFASFAFRHCRAKEQPLRREEPRFNTFFGVVDRYAVWVESVPGLSDARARMEALAAEKPGVYFLFPAKATRF